MGGGKKNPFSTTIIPHPFKANTWQIMLQIFPLKCSNTLKPFDSLFKQKRLLDGGCNSEEEDTNDIHQCRSSHVLPHCNLVIAAVVLFLSNLAKISGNVQNH